MPRPCPTEAEVRTLLERLGTPQEIADESLATCTGTEPGPPLPSAEGSVGRTGASGFLLAARANARDRRCFSTGVVAGFLALAALVGGGLYGQVRGFLLWQRALAWGSASVILLCGLLATSCLALTAAQAVASRAPGALAGTRYRVTGIVAGVVAVAALVAWSLDGHAVGSIVQRVVWWGCPLVLLFCGLLAACCLLLSFIRTIAGPARTAAAADSVVVGVTGVAFTVLAILIVVHVL